MDDFLIKTDEGRFQQVLYNLSSNAIKWSKEGSSVVISVEFLPTNLVYMNHSMRVLIVDNGGLM